MFVLVITQIGEQASPNDSVLEPKLIQKRDTFSPSKLKSTKEFPSGDTYITVNTHSCEVPAVERTKQPLTRKARECHIVDFVNAIQATLQIGTS